MNESTNEQTITTSEESPISKLRHFIFPTVYPHCYRIKVIINGEQLYPIDTENSTLPLYQLLDNIILDKYSDFNGGAQAACAPNVRDSEHYDIEPWSDVSTNFIPPTVYSLRLSDNEDDTKEEGKAPPAAKEILVSRLVHLLGNQRYNYRLGCINNRSFNFRRSDGSVHIGVFPQCEEDKIIMNMLEDDYINSVNEFIDLVLEVLDGNNENEHFSLHMAAHLCDCSIQAERDEFLAIVTPKNQCIIMIGLFYNRFYY
ncbi:unnamed protein product [Rotaria sp. Silwood2]|nr:unnamed protein product [Rotaria sp. Silwood2]CAF4147901.1 unnamed protein product [Rotaria sp. Silwood2]